MGRRGPFRWGLALAVVLVAQQALAEEGVCRSGCRGAPKIFKYAEGTTYKYNYDGKIEISLSSAEEGQVSSTEIKATVLLTQLADCNQLLRLQNVQILGSNGNKYGHLPDLEKPIRINFHDGHIEDSICTVPGDTQNSLNIKRAIASLFQANYRGSHETDVFGLCPTEFAQHNDGHFVVIQKSRNLNKCAYRENIRQDFLNTIFNVHSEMKSSPILNGDYNAKLRIKDGILEQANTVENYLFVPFSVGKNGAKAQVTSKLHLAGNSKENPKSSCSKPKSIIFDNPHPISAPTSNINTILEAVKGVVKTIDISVGENTAKEFVTLIKTIRAAKKEDLLAVYNQVKSGTGFSDRVAAKKVFLDALLQAASADAVEVAITLLKSNEFNDMEKKLVYAGLSFVRHSSESLLNTATSLLAQRNLPYEVYLGIGNIAGRYCQQHPCENVDALNKLTQKLIQKLGDNKAGNRQEENEMVFVLKSLGNFGHLSDSVLQKIISIAQDKQAPNRLRVVALETYLSDPCKDKLRNSALSILQDIQQDSEIRIKAYLAATQCPNAKVGNAVKALLEKEPSLQVGGFIVSHIRSIKASANPDKNLAKQYLSFSVPKRFPIDFRKYSYNGEFSYAIDTLGMAASSESNIIYSQDSFLPRSASLNLTTEIFGHTLNFLELQTRQENLDKLVEHYFGPKGLLRTSSWGNLIKENEQTASKSWQYLNEQLNSVLRTRRDVSKAEIESIGKAVQIKENVLNKDLDLDLSVKAFGSEIFFTNLNVYQEGLTPKAIVDKIMDSFKEGLDKLKNFKETLRSNLILLDMEFDYPTSLGFPLRLAAEGSANIQVEAEGKIDVRELLRTAGGELKLKLIPSANVEVSSRLTLDASVVESGLKLVSTLYSATGGDLSIKLPGENNEFDIKFGLPIQEQKILAANHEIVIHTREQAGQEKNTPLKFKQQKDFSICIDQLSPFIGLVFCGDLNGPNLAGRQTPILPFPLAGDAKVAVTIENEDISYYHIKGFLNKDHKAAEFLVAAIGKNNQKKTEFSIKAGLSNGYYVKAVLESPLKTAYAEASLTDLPNEKSLMAKFGHDQTEFYGKLGLTISGSQSKRIYKPILEYKVPEGIQVLPVRVEGQIIAEEKPNGKKFIFDHVKLCLTSEQEYSLSGDFGTENDAFFTDLALSNSKLTLNLKGRLIIQEELMKINAEFTNSINPALNFNLKGESKRLPNLYESSLQLIHGSDLSSKTNKLIVSYKLENTWNGPGNYSFCVESKIGYPLIGLSAEYEFKSGPRTLEYEIDFQYNEIKLGSEFELGINKKHLGDFDIEFSLYGLENKVAIKCERQVQGDTSTIVNELEVNGKKMEVKGKVKHLFKSGNIDIGADLTVVIPTHPTPFKVNSGLKYNPNDYDIHHKVTSGTTVIVDAFIKGNKEGTANGSFKVNIKDYLVVNGQVKSQKGTGTADLLIEAQKVQQQIKVDSSFKIHTPSVYDIDVTIYPSYEKDKQNKIKFSTHNKIDPNNLNSKSSLDVLGKKMDLNIVGKKTGNEQTGSENGEIEIILPNDFYILFKLNDNREHKNDRLNGDGIVSLEYRKNKNVPGRKLSLKSTYKNTNFQEGLYDVTYVISADDSNGQNINADIYCKRLRQGEQVVTELGNKIYGSLIKNTIVGNLKSICEQNSGKLDISSSYGANTNLKLGGSYSLPDEGKPIAGDVHLQLSTPNKQLKTLDLELSGSLLKPTNPTEHLEVKGSAKLFADDDGSVPEPIVDFKGDGFVRASDKDGSFEGNVNYGKQGPISAKAGYNVNEKGKQKRVNGNAALSYGEGKKLQLAGSLVKSEENHYMAEAELETPFENYHSTKFVAEAKQSSDQKHITTAVQVMVDGKQFKWNNELQLSNISPLVDVKINSFDGKAIQFYLKGNKVSDRDFGGEIKINWEAINFFFEGDLNANLENMQNFLVKANVNSPNLNLNKLHIEAQNKAGKGDRKILITIKSAGTNLITGSTNYQIREDSDKFIAEGSGSFKIKDQSTSGNFKFVSQRLSSDRNGEDGFETSLDINLGKRTIDAVFKLSDKQLKWLNSYCEKPKDCSRIEINSNIKHNDAKLYDQSTIVTIDLRKLGIPHDFNLKATTQRKESSFDHTVDVHFNSGATKYQYNVYLHPSKAGISLTTPKRIVSLEAKVDIPKEIKEGGKFSGDVSFYLDKKNAPNKKSSIEGWLEVNVNQHRINGQIKVHHPGLPRTLTIAVKGSSEVNQNRQKVSVNAEVDVFAKPEQKIIAEYKGSSDIATDIYNSATSLKIKSSGLGINIEYSDNSNLNKHSYSVEYESQLKYNVGKSNYEDELSLKGNREEFKFLVRLCNTNLLKISSKMSLTKDHQTIDSEISSYDNSPLLTHLDIKNFNTLLLTVGMKNTPREKVQFNAGLIPTQIADIRSDHITAAGKVNLFHATVHLEEANFLKPDFNVNSKEIEAVIEKAEKQFTNYIIGLKEKGKEWADINTRELAQLGQIIKALPNPIPIKEYYTSELNKIKDEFLEDNSIKEILKILNNTFGVVIQSTVEILNILTDLVNSVTHSLQELYFGVVEAIEKELVPPIKELADRVTGIISEITKSALEILSAYMAILSQLFEKYQPQFREIAAIFGEIGQDIARFIQNAYLQSAEILAELVEKVYNELKAIPLYEELKAQYNELLRDLVPTLDGIIGGLKEIASTVKDLIPGEILIKPELVQIIDLTVLYVEKKLKQEEVNDWGILDKIISNELSIARKILGLLSSPSYNRPNADVPFTLDYLRNLPKLVAIKFSPIAYILKEDPTNAIVSFVSSLVNNPRRWVPPFPLYAILVQGQYIFTFDGKLINFPGNCKYLLARDAVNGNFTLAGTYVNGNLNSITLADHTDSITIKKGGQVLLNNVATELPTRKPDLAAYRDYEMIHLVSLSGITVSCLPDLEGCGVSISGFYHGQVKGLLGNGNNEPYDDLTIPNGKIVTKEAEFGNSYKIGNCQPVNIPKHDNVPESAECNKLFSWESSLRLCYPFVNTNNFKAACAQGSASKVKHIELLIARAYVAACWEHSIPISVPTNLLKCTNSDKPFQVGDSFSVKLPSKAADIVLIVDTLKENEPVYKEFFQPLVAEVVKTLQAKGINDVQFHLITYGGDNKWPSHVTVGGKLQFKGKAPNLKFSKQEIHNHPELNEYLPFKNYIIILEELLYDFQLAVGQDLTAQTFTEAYYYPFRANALKSILVVNSKPCEVGKLFLLQKLRTLLFRNNLISVNLITPLKELSLKDNKKTKDVIGFNDNHVFTISQAKKKPEGAAELYKDLDWNDFCVDFTIKNRGNVFGTNNFIDSKPDVKKQFIHVAAYNIVNELVTMEQGLDCECKQINPYNAYSVCKEAYTKEKN